MTNFDYCSPTKVIFGKGTRARIGEELKAWGAKKVMICYGGQSAIKSGLLEQVEKSLSASGIAYVKMGGFQANPVVKPVLKGAELAREENVDFMLGVGGGSVIDSAKAIGLAVANPDADIWADYFDAKKVAPACLPIACILTLPATGTEVSQTSVLTQEEGRLKKGYINALFRPKFSILDPELTYTLSPYQTACGIVDIMMHTIERYFTPTKHVVTTDRLCEGLLRSMIEVGPKALADPLNYDVRAEIMWTGSISHNDLLGTGRVTDWGTHQLGQELSGKYDVAHGPSLTAMFGSWARYVMDADISKFVQYAVRVWDVDITAFDDPKAIAEEGIRRTEDFFRSLHMPVGLKELNVGEITDADIDELSEKCVFYGRRTISNFKVLHQDDCNKIYHMARDNY